jgi:GLPGLI family protein
MQLPDDAPEEMKNMIPPTQTSQHVLVYNGQTTLYRPASEEDKKDLDLNHEGDGGGELRIKMVRPHSVIHTDIDQWKATESREFMGRSFLVRDEPKSFTWKQTAERKKIQQFDCQKAVLQDTARTVVAWYTTAIPVSSGPDGYNGLPGMILELDIDNGTRTIALAKADSTPPAAIEVPTKGKECTRAEYEKTVADKKKEIEAENGGGPHIILKRN